MRDDERDALASLRFDWAPVPDDLWRPQPFHVDGLHLAVQRAIAASIGEAVSSSAGSPLGLVMQGQGGSGKTHLLGSVRQQVQDKGGYFFLVSMLDAEAFWESVLSALLDGLSRPVPGSRQTQLGLFLQRLSTMVAAPRSARRAVMGESVLTREALDEFITGLGEFDPHVARSCQETARALALSASPDVELRFIAESYFVSGEEMVPGERRAWGIRRSARSPRLIVQEISRLLAMTGPSVIAIDQIDTLVAQFDITTDPAVGGAALLQPQDAKTLAQLADGLMSLRDQTRRTVTVIACLPTTWTILTSVAVTTVRDRFRQTPQLRRFRDAAIARRIIETRFTNRFTEIGFDAPFDSWPVLPEAFDIAKPLTPRELLVRIDQHISKCLADDQVEMMYTISDPPLAAAQPLPKGEAGVDVSAEEISRLDERFAELKLAADDVSPLERDAEDEKMPALLSAGLSAWVLERGNAGAAFSVDPPPGSRPALHARLRLTLDDKTEDQVHWCFRAVSHEHHFNSVLSRLTQAKIAAAAETKTGKRNLYMLRNKGWSRGDATRKQLAAVTARLEVDREDLGILSALQLMLAESPVQMRGWLIKRQPTRDLKFLGEALAGVGRWLPLETQTSDDHDRGAPNLTIGYDQNDGTPITVALEQLRKHTTIFAGSGSGKTVLIRRIVEECALRGVSAIVLDPNNDLARLGDAWPQAPQGWRTDDPEKAADYLANTDVVIWTPRRSSGRPLSLQPLPDFPSVLEDDDEFQEAVDAAVAALVPRALIAGRAAKAHTARAVLRKAIEYYGRQGGTTLPGLIDTLAALPEGIIDIDDAGKIAAGLAQTLTAEMVNDPLFGGDATPLDPGLLLNPAPGKRARVSVISMVGLPTDTARQTFVNQLQMALFTWIKQHPAGDRPLSGLLVMDEAQTLAPVSPMTACTQSTLMLTAQARKYGLGLLFATQAPKGLHNRIPGNCSTQLYGLLNSPVQIEAIRDMAKAKGGDVNDISRLGTGEFYLAAEGSAPRKIKTPLCLTNHPRSPLTTEEVLARADSPY